MSETEIRTITGRCSEVSEKNGWTAFAIDVGTQYPVRLSTKLDPLIELGRAASKDGGVFEWTYKESQGGENPHKPGTFYTNRYLEAVAAANEYDGQQPEERVATPADVQKAHALPVQGSGDGMSKDEWRAKDRAADRRACIAIAASALQHTMPSDPSTEDLAKFDERVKYLSRHWHLQVEAVRNEDESDVPFSGAPMTAHDEAIPFG